jgi:hypothetical protein
MNGAPSPASRSRAGSFEPGMTLTREAHGAEAAQLFGLFVGELFGESGGIPGVACDMQKP